MSEEEALGSLEGDEAGIDFQVEFSKKLSQCDENVVNTLMPLVVNIMDCMNVGYQQKIEYEQKLQRVLRENAKFQKKESNSKAMLDQKLQEYMIKYEREREARIFIENRLAEYEQHAEKHQKQMSDRVEALEYHVQTLEKKFKLSTECIEKLEIREQYLKKEYSGLLERYTKLFREHINYMEKVNIPKNHRDLTNDDAVKELVSISEECETDTLANPSQTTYAATDSLSVGLSEEVDADEHAEADQDMDVDEDADTEVDASDTVTEHLEDESESLVDNISLTQSIKNISRLPLPIKPATRSPRVSY